jgi:hypothetical protein
MIFIIRGSSIEISRRVSKNDELFLNLKIGQVVYLRYNIIKFKFIYFLPQNMCESHK